MKGFTLIEVLVVAAITVMLTGFLIQSFSRSRTDLNQSASALMDAIREAQSSALSGELVRGTYRCGYGIHFDAGSYEIFAGPDASQPGVDCSAGRVYPGTGTTVISSTILSNNTLEIVQPVPDIFFEPPDPTTYIDGSNAPGTSATVSIRVKGAQCPGTDCRSINVTTSGLIQPQ
ncbi:MAG TPA: type II secretion system protein [Candidatus Paceibacterota bacterium]|nr:type II secretion system protein [Candidatus Paceibacterota bacterium]